jgi:putative membrane protein
MKLIFRFLISGIIVILLAHFLKGVYIAHFYTAFIVAVVLSLLNLIVRPILVLFTLPVTLITFGLFLLVINAVIILLCTEIISDFKVASFWTALLFSVLLSISQSIVFGVFRNLK